MQCLCSILSLSFVNIGEAFTFDLEIECNFAYKISMKLAEGILHFL